jgi:HAD superfamily hydrolase (TIGR01509 family)
MLKAAIFDFDGVIINSESIHHQVEQEIFRSYGIELTREDYMEFAGVSELDTYKLIRQKYEVDFDPLIVLKEKINLFIKTIETYEQIPQPTGILNFIDNLYSNRMLLSIATSGTRDVAYYVLKKTELLDKFNFMLCGDNISKSKPSPEIFQKSLKISQVGANETIVIEDSGHGVEAAKKAGIKVVAYKNPDTGSQELKNADMIIDDFNQVNYSILSEVL